MPEKAIENNIIRAKLLENEITIKGVFSQWLMCIVRSLTNVLLSTLLAVYKTQYGNMLDGVAVSFRSNKYKAIIVVLYSLLKVRAVSMPSVDGSIQRKLLIISDWFRPMNARAKRRQRNTFVATHFWLGFIIFSSTHAFHSEHAFNANYIWNQTFEFQM